MKDALNFADTALKLAQSLSPEYCEAYAEHTYSSSYAIEQGIVNGSAYGEEIGIRIRLIKDKRLYTLSTNRLEKDNIVALLGRFKRFNGVDVTLSEEKAEHADYRVREKKSVDRQNMLKDLIYIDKELGRKKYVRYRSVYGGTGRYISYFVNSEGSSVVSNIPSYSAFVLFTVGNGKGTRQSVLQYGGTGGYERFVAEDIAKESGGSAGRLYGVMENGVTLGSPDIANVKNVVLSPELIGIAAHESVGHPTEADRVFGREAAQAGTSYITREDLGMRIGSDEVTIIDDPTIPNSNGFYLYDEEGVRSRPKVLVDSGMQEELLMDRQYARLLKVESNAAARSDHYSNEPLIRMSNTYLKPGTSTIDELFSEARNGIYMKSFDSTEWNIDDTRSFARYMGNEAYLIKNGELGKPVKNYKLEIYTLDFWNAVRLRSKDFGLYVGSCGKGEPMQGVPVTMGGCAALLTLK